MDYLISELYIFGSCKLGECRIVLCESGAKHRLQKLQLNFPRLVFWPALDIIPLPKLVISIRILFNPATSNFGFDGSPFHATALPSEENLVLFCDLIWFYVCLSATMSHLHSRTARSYLGWPSIYDSSRLNHSQFFIQKNSFDPHSSFVSIATFSS